MNPYKNSISKQENTQQRQKTGSDKIEISNTAKELQQHSSLIADRQKKIEAIQVQVDTGTYKVDPEKVAKGMIEFFRKNTNK